MHRVAVLAFDGMAPFELGVVVEVFGLARPELAAPWWYELEICAEAEGPLRLVGGAQLVPGSGLDALARADTVIVPGTPDVHGTPSDALIAALRTAAARGARIVSICSGAFTLAAAGLLDGKQAATHWQYADLLRRRFPAVRVNAEQLYLDQGAVLTSAGSAAGIDLCLYLVRRDHGAEIANAVARRLVVAPHRDGGQAQFIEAPVAPDVDQHAIARTMEWACGLLAERLTVPAMAAHAHMSVRTFTRRFRAASGTSPKQWLLDQRVAAALPLLESSELPIEIVASTVGFESAVSFRQHFARVMRTTPSRYRREFGIMR